MSMMAERIFRVALIGGVLAAVGCDSGTTASSTEAPRPVSATPAALPKPATVALTQTAQAATQAAIKSEPETKKKHPGGEPVVFPPPLKWYGYEEGLAEAKRTGKSILVLIYADWCPKCHLVPSQLTEPEFLKLSTQFVLVHVDYEVDTPWVRAFNAKQGTYLPRILFIKPDGSWDQTITSGNQRYPFFYGPQAPQALQDSMKRALHI
jgi:thiol:disulfide interchange protein